MIAAPRHGIIIVDDEPLARRRLRQLCSSAPDFDIVGECADARELHHQVRALRPAVVFLDIHMPHVDGFEARQAIRTAVRHVVFVTAHVEHAARAFDVAASDYLVKPVSQKRFDEALQRVRYALGGAEAPRVLLGGRHGGTALAVSEIVWVEADGAYVVVHAAGRRHVLRDSLAEFVSRTRLTCLIRTHRSAAVNIGHVRAVKRPRAGLLELELSDGTRVPVSRRLAHDVLSSLGATSLP